MGVQLERLITESQIKTSFLWNTEAGLLQSQSGILLPPWCLLYTADNKKIKNFKAGSEKYSVSPSPSPTPAQNAEQLLLNHSFKSTV